MSNTKPKLIIVTGRPGSGKSTLSKELGLLMKFPVFSRDELKEGYVHTFGAQHSELPEDTNKTVTDAFFEIIKFTLSKNISLIAEAAFQHHVWEKGIEQIKEICDISIIVCTVDDHVAAERHLQRGLADPEREFFHGDERVTHYRKTGEKLGPAEYNPPNFSLPTIVVSTENGYSPSLNLIKKKLFD